MRGTRGRATRAPKRPEGGGVWRRVVWKCTRGRGPKACMIYLRDAADDQVLEHLAMASATHREIVQLSSSSAKCRCRTRRTAPSLLHREALPQAVPRCVAARAPAASAGGEGVGDHVVRAVVEDIPTESGLRCLRVAPPGQRRAPRWRPCAWWQGEVIVVGCHDLMQHLPDRARRRGGDAKGLGVPLGAPVDASHVVGERVEEAALAVDRRACRRIPLGQPLLCIR